MQIPAVTPFFHEQSNTWTYVVQDTATGRAVIIDPCLDFDAAAARTSTTSADAVADFVTAQGLQVDWILETHAHADHLSAGAHLRQRLGAPIAIGSGISAVQQAFSAIYNLGDEFPVDGSQFERTLPAGSGLSCGSLAVDVIPVPGHTSDSVAYRIGDAVFVGDSLFMPDGGTARCDFPGGDAGVLYDSIQRLYELPDDTRVFVCHDYGPGGREVRCETTIGEQRRSNIHVQDTTPREEFVARRTERDATLSMPKLILPAIQVNIRAGELPPPESNGVSYLRIPLNRF